VLCYFILCCRKKTDYYVGAHVQKNWSEEHSQKSYEEVKNTGLRCTVKNHDAKFGTITDIIAPTMYCKIITVMYFLQTTGVDCTSLRQIVLLSYCF